jgi:hypothetical protein
MSHPIGTKKAKIVKYLQDSGVVIGGEKVDNSFSMQSTSNLELMLA